MSGRRLGKRNMAAGTGGYVKMAKKQDKGNSHFVFIYIGIALLLAAYRIFILGFGAVGSLLGSFLLIYVGLLGVMSGFMHWYRPTADKIAREIGWPIGSGFQKEVAAAGAAFGILGILSYWIHGNFWTATVIGWSFMIFMMGIGHVLDLRKNKNKSILNAGPILYADLLMPILMMALLVLWKMGY